MSEWQPIETAPKDSYILLSNLSGVWVGVYQPVYSSGFVPKNPWSSRMLNHNHLKKWDAVPTHWMPLPEQPK